MEKRYDSDLTPKERRQKEIRKIKSLHGKKRLQYLWDYYKIVPAILLGCIVAGAFFATMIRGMNQTTVLSFVVTDANPMSDWAGLNSDLLAVTKGDAKHPVVEIDSSVRSFGDANEEMNKTIKLSAANDTDLVVCGEKVLDEYEALDAFVSWQEVLGDDFAAYEPYIKDGMLDVSQSKRWQEGQYTAYEPAYLCMMHASKRPDSCRAVVKYLFSD